MKRYYITILQSQERQSGVKEEGGGGEKAEGISQLFYFFIFVGFKFSVISAEGLSCPFKEDSQSLSKPVSDILVLSAGTVYLEAGSPV